MGATQAYYWGLMYPDFVQAVMPVGGATATDGEGQVAAWTFQLAKAALEADPVWVETKGNYYHLPKDKHPNKGVEYHWSVLSLTGYDLATARARAGTRCRRRSSAGSPIRAWARTPAPISPTWPRSSTPSISGTATPSARSTTSTRCCPAMKPRTLVVHVDNDQWLIADKARAAAQAIPGAQYAGLSSPIAHYAVFSALNTLADDPMLNTFVRDIGLVEDKTKVCDAGNYRNPRVNMKPDPAKSFWKDEMVSPFPVKYAKVKDRRGVEWEIGYIDEYCGKDKNPPVLVVVHGKGAFAAHYGYLIKYAVERGYRVIAPDMPQWGTSGPGNLDKPMTRTLDDVRDAFHALIVGKLGVKKAFYHGHSLGGATVLGYTLRYPDAVRGLILEGPAGLEEYPKNIKLGDKELPLCDKSFAYDRKRWEEVYGPTGMIEGEGKRTEQGVRDFFYFKQRDPKTGAVTPSYSGYFKVDTEYARLHTDQRIAMISGNKRELDQWVFMFIYDLYSICSEVAARRSGQHVQAAAQDQGADVPRLRRAGAVHSRHPAQRPAGPGQRHHQPVHEADDGGRQQAGAEGLSGRRSLHPHRRAVRVRARHGGLHAQRARRRGLARGRRNAGQGRAGWRRRRPLPPPSPPDWPSEGHAMKQTGAFAMKTLHSIVLGAAAGLLAACATPPSAPPPAAPPHGAGRSAVKEITAEPGEGRGDAQLQRAGAGQAQALLHDPELPPRRQVRPRCESGHLAQRRRRRHDARVARLGSAAGGVHRRRHAEAQRQGRDHQRRHRQHLLLR